MKARILLTLFAVAASLVLACPWTVQAQETAGLQPAQNAATMRQPPAPPTQPNRWAPTNPREALPYFLLCILLGVGGQLARAIVGIREELHRAAPDESWKNWFDWSQFMFSLGLGAIAGLLYALFAWGNPFDKQLLMGAVAPAMPG